MLEKLDKQFDHLKFEDILYHDSLNSFCNSSDTSFKKTEDNSKTFTIMMPPPNVTGSLHLGHALTYTLQDVLVRAKRAFGYDVLYQAGTDHAGIAMQLVVQRQLESQGIDCKNLSKEEFLKHLWEWKKKNGEKIVNQQKKLRISPNWNRSKFTLDADLSKIVNDTFIKLYNEGLIYKDKKLVNWDSKLQSAVSDLEVIVKEIKGEFYYIKYEVLDCNQKPLNDYLIVATTRPETMFGDSAVCINKIDSRYTKYHNCFVKIPICNRIIPIILDDYCDIEKASGAVKITPAHDLNDFEVGKRHQLDNIIIIDKDAKLNGSFVPNEYNGLSIKKARDVVIKELEQLGLLDKIETSVTKQPISEKSDVDIEYQLSDQWFFDIRQLKQKAIACVEDKIVNFFPDHYKNTYFEWLKNLEPWCISRQIIWGHEIPAWYSDDGSIFVASTLEQAQEMAFKKFNKNIELKKETDVLDTWFSSALWPFSTLHDFNDSNYYYPKDNDNSQSTLITGFDIIFFWVARMIMMGIYEKGFAPFKNIYIHTLVRDEKGQKMSKTKGNVIDPLTIIEKYGSDALRFTLTKLSSPGSDIKLGEKKIEEHRNFITKIWNASNFLINNSCFYEDDFLKNINLNELHPVHKLMLKKISLLHKELMDCFENQESLNFYRYDIISNKIEQSFYEDFCSFYLEFVKILLSDNKYAEHCKKVSCSILFEYLKILHFFMPSVTSFLAKHFKMSEVLSAFKWDDTIKNINNHKDFNDSNFSIFELINTKNNLTISAINNLRLLYKINPQQYLDIYFDKESLTVLEVRFDDFIKVFKEFNLEQYLVKKAKINNISYINNEQYLNYLNSDFDTINNVNALKILINTTEIISNEEKNNIKNKYLQDITIKAGHLELKISNDKYKAAKPEQWQLDYEELQNIQKILTELKNAI